MGGRLQNDETPARRPSQWSLKTKYVISSEDKDTESSCLGHHCLCDKSHEFTVTQTLSLLISSLNIN